eukprot:CFRG3998T1
MNKSKLSSTSKNIQRLAAVSGAIAIGLKAYGAHGLPNHDLKFKDILCGRRQIYYIWHIQRCFLCVTRQTAKKADLDIIPLWIHVSWTGAYSDKVYVFLN